MVLDRIKGIKIFVILILTVFFLSIAVTKKDSVETDFAKAVLPKDVVNNTKIIPLIKHSAETIEVVFESYTPDGAEELKQKFINDVDNKKFEIISEDFSGLLDLYAKAPENFISPQTRKMLKSKNYDAVYKNGIERLYNPTGFSPVSLEQDPFMLLTDFLCANDTIQKNKSFGGKYYDTEILKLKGNNGNIKELIKIKNRHSDKDNNIYLAGTPIHTYYTTLSSTISINIICVLITFLIIFLTYFYFKNFKLLIPILLSLSFGFLAGYSVTRYLFCDFHLITLLFGTTLIGIGVDYSFHFLFKENFDSKFIKDLSLSLLSTVSAFALLFLIGTDILNQISTFTIVGLIAVYLFIVMVYPLIKFPEPQKIYSPEVSDKYKYGIIIFVAAVIAMGLLRVKFNDNLTALYTPNKFLKKSEILFGKISNQNNDKNYIIAVKGKTLENILENEEEVTSQLDKDEINYVCISNFFPSLKRQQENAGLVKELYGSKLDKYSEFLSQEQINRLKQKNNSLIFFDIKKYPFANALFLDNQTSLIVVFSDKAPLISSDNIEIISIQKTLSDCLKQHRLDLEKILPVVYLFLFFILLIFYGLKKSVKMFLPIFMSQIFAAAFLCLIGIKLNMFSILGLILSLGFTVDYAIFGENKTKRASSAIFAASVTTALSFMLLVFTTFKLISMMALTTSVCIISSYIFVRIFMQEK